MPKFAVHTAENTRSEQRTEGITDEISTRKHSGPYTELLPGVPFTQQEESTREEGCLDETKEESSQQRAHEATIRTSSALPEGKKIGQAYLVVTPVKHEIIPQTIIQQGR